MRISDWSSDVCSSDLLEKCVGINGALAAAVRPRENPERGPVKMVRHYSAAMASCFSLRRSRDTLDLKTERRSLLNVLLLTSITRTRCALPDESRTVRVVTSDEPLSLKIGKAQGRDRVGP